MAMLAGRLRSVANAARLRSGWSLEVISLRACASRDRYTSASAPDATVHSISYASERTLTGASPEAAICRMPRNTAREDRPVVYAWRSTLCIAGSIISRLPLVSWPSRLSTAAGGIFYRELNPRASHTISWISRVSLR
jgi:hypothetical protein